MKKPSYIARRSNNALRAFKEKLSNIPQSGNGLHYYLMTLALSGKKARIEQGQLFELLKEATDKEKVGRLVSDREIKDTLDKCYNSKGKYRLIEKPKTVFKADAFHSICEHGKQGSLTHFKSASPIKIPDNPKEQCKAFLNALYKPLDKVLLGDTYTYKPEELFTVQEFTDGLQFLQDEHLPELIVMNPLSGATYINSNGNDSVREHTLVSHYQYCLAEFDNPEHFPLEKQLKFWAGWQMIKDVPKIKSIVYSGGKSYHVLLKVNLNSYDEWETTVKSQIVQGMFKPLGIDTQNQNPAGFTRLAGGNREGKTQELIYLSDI